MPILEAEKQEQKLDRNFLSDEPKYALRILPLLVYFGKVLILTNAVGILQSLTSEGKGTRKEVPGRSKLLRPPFKDRASRQ